MKCSQERLVAGHPKVTRLPAQTRGKDKRRLGGPHWGVANGHVPKCSMEREGSAHLAPRFPVVPGHV